MKDNQFRIHFVLGKEQLYWAEESFAFLLIELNWWFSLCFLSRNFSWESRKSWRSRRAYLKKFWGVSLGNRNFTHIVFYFGDLGVPLFCRVGIRGAVEPIGLSFCSIQGGGHVCQASFWIVLAEDNWQTVDMFMSWLMFALNDFGEGVDVSFLDIYFFWKKVNYAY